MPDITLAAITNTLLDETSPTASLHHALDRYAAICSHVSGIEPDPGFSGWAGDTFLDQGTAINPQAAAFCVLDYQRSIMFIRGIYAALRAAQAHFKATPIDILYAGCGPFATLLLPLLNKFEPGELKLFLIDIHQPSLDSVHKLRSHFGLQDYALNTIAGDACNYQHSGPLHVIIVEAMQKSLEQEPQFAITANLAPQLLPQGIFVPEKIEVQLCLAQLEQEKRLFERDQALDTALLIATQQRQPLGTIFTLLPANAAAQLQQATYNETTATLELPAVDIGIPSIENITDYDVAFFTRVNVHAQYALTDYQAAITLPQKCHDLKQLQGGECYKVSYQLGNYPKFCISQIDSGQINETTQGH